MVKFTQEADRKTRLLCIEDERKVVTAMFRKLSVALVLTILLLALVLSLGVFAPLAHTGSEENTAGSEESTAGSADDAPQTADPWWWQTYDDPNDDPNGDPNDGVWKSKILRGPPPVVAATASPSPAAVGKPVRFVGTVVVWDWDIKRTWRERWQ